MKYKTYILIITLITLFSCGNSKKKESIFVESNESIATNKFENHPGKAVYDKYCLACHMADGKGIPGIHPPLSNKWLDNKKDLLNVILNGMSGEIEVDDVRYNNIMPAHKHLTNKQIVDVSNYIRRNFGNSEEDVTITDVQDLRD